MAVECIIRRVVIGSSLASEVLGGLGVEATVDPEIETATPGRMSCNFRQLDDFLVLGEVG